MRATDLQRAPRSRPPSAAGAPEVAGPIRAAPSRPPRECRAEPSGTDIEMLCAALNRQLARSWRHVADRHARHLAPQFSMLGIDAYAIYLAILQRPLERDLASRGLLVYPPLPGACRHARAWPVGDSIIERWSWSSCVLRDDEQAVGTIVTALQCCERKFHVARAPWVFGIAAAGVANVERDLSTRCAGFAAAARRSCDVLDHIGA